MAEINTEFAWVKFYSEVTQKMLSWPIKDREERLHQLLERWIGKDFENPLPSYVLAEITTPKTYPARATKAKCLAQLLGIENWPGDFSGVAGTYSGSAFLNSPAPTKELVDADWDLMAAAINPNVLSEPHEFVNSLQRVYDALVSIGRGKDRAEVTKFVANLNPDVFIPLDANNRTELEEDKTFTAAELKGAEESAEKYVELIKKWHEDYKDVKPLVFNHHAWEKALGMPITPQ